MKKLYLICVLQVFLAQFAFSAVCMGDGFLEINVQSLTVVEHDNILLGNIAEVTGDEKKSVIAARSVFLSSAPSANRSIIMGENSIKKALKKNGFDLNNIKLRFPGKITIERKLNKITEGEIRKAVQDYIYKKMPWQKERVEISEINYKGDITLPGSDIEIKISMDKNRDFIGKVYLSLVFKANGKVLKRQKISAKLKVKMPVLLAGTNLKKGRIISARDVYIEDQWTSTEPSSGVYSSIKEAIGKKVKRKINAGQPLKESLLEIPSDIEKGERVTILAAKKTLRITAPGIAREDGVKGQTIKVKNTSSNRIVYARVVDSSTVQVDF